MDACRNPAGRSNLTSGLLQSKRPPPGGLFVWLGCLGEITDPVRRIRNSHLRPCASAQTWQSHTHARLFRHGGPHARPANHHQPAGHQRAQRTGNTRGRPGNTALGWKAIAPGGLRRGIRRKFPAPIERLRPTGPTSAVRKPPHQSPARPADQPGDSPPPAWTPAARCRK